MAEGLAEQLAEFSLLSFGEDAEAARAMVRLSLFDWAVCGIAGIPEPVSGVLRQVEGMTSRGPASAFGLSLGIPLRAAALINGTTSHALDYDDTHFGHIGHPSVAVIPAALAMAERQGATLQALVDAALVGMEASIRVGLWLGRAHYEVGFHQTGTAGAFGAALAAGRLAGLSQDQLAHTLGTVSTLASGLKSQFGTMGKPLNAGHAAEVGVQAVLLTEAGFTSTPEAVDGPQGFGPTHHGERALRSALEGLGDAWEVLGLRHKFHACCHGLHAMLEALAGLDVLPDQIELIDVSTHPRWLSVCNQLSPDTGLGAKFSYRVTAAMALTGRSTAQLESYSAETCAAPDVVALRDRVSVGGHDDLSETEARVRITLKDGRIVTLHHDLAAAMPHEELSDKLREKGTALLGAETSGRLWAGVQGGRDLQSLTASIRGVA